MRKLNVTDGRTDRQTDGRTGGVAISPVPGPTAPAGDKRCNISRPRPTAPVGDNKHNTQHDKAVVQYKTSINLHLVQFDIVKIHVLIQGLFLVTKFFTFVLL